MILCHSVYVVTYFFACSQNSNLLNAARLQVLKAREDHIKVSPNFYLNMLW